MRVRRWWEPEDGSVLTLVLLGSLLVLRFFWSAVSSPVPLGYDAGINRYLFVRYAEAGAPFAFPDLPLWAREHPPGLFLLSSLVLRLGVPPDWFIGWIWNAMPIALACIAAGAVMQRWGGRVAQLSLLFFALSPAFYDGFAAMYWKNFAALLWMVLAFSFLERRRWVPGMVCSVLLLLTHHQTALLFLLAVCTFACCHCVARRVLLALVLSATVGGVAVLLYGPSLDAAVLRMVPLLLRGWSAPEGNFPPPLLYFTVSWPILVLGFMGFLWSLRQERWTLWQLTVLWSMCIVGLRLMFYRRFFLHFEFFLIPFAAVGTVLLWRRWPSVLVRASIVALLLMQGVFAVRVMSRRVPEISPEVFLAVTALPAQLPENALVLALEPTTAPFLRGWLPKSRIASPGLFEAVWYYPQWEQFLLGTAEERGKLLAKLRGPVFLFRSPLFHELYGEDARRFLADPCFVAVRGNTYLMEVEPRCLAVR